MFPEGGEEQTEKVWLRDGWKRKRSTDRSISRLKDEGWRAHFVLGFLL